MWYAPPYEKRRSISLTLSAKGSMAIMAVLLLSACSVRDTPVLDEELTMPAATEEPTVPAAPSPTAGPVLYTVNVTGDVPYHTAESEEVTEDKLDIYAPAESGDWPVVVVFHGAEDSKGGSLAILSNRVAERGAVVFTPDIHSARAVHDDPAGMREFLEKHDCAVRFAQAHAAEYGGDATNMVVFGQSSGGYGGLWVSLVPDEIGQIWDEYGGAKGGDGQQVGCLAEGSADATGAFVGYGGAYAYFDVTLGPEENELLTVLSPSTYFGKNTELAIRFIHGENDSILPNSAVELHKAWVEALTEMGYDAAWLEMAGGHDLELISIDPLADVIKDLARR